MSDSERESQEPQPSRELVLLNQILAKLEEMEAVRADFEEDPDMTRGDW